MSVAQNSIMALFHQYPLSVVFLGGCGSPWRSSFPQRVVYACKNSLRLLLGVFPLWEGQEKREYLVSWPSGKADHARTQLLRSEGRVQRVLRVSFTPLCLVPEGKYQKISQGDLQGQGICVCLTLKIKASALKKRIWSWGTKSNEVRIWTE